MERVLERQMAKILFLEQLLQHMGVEQVSKMEDVVEVEVE